MPGEEGGTAIAETLAFSIRGRKLLPR